MAEIKVRSAGEAGWAYDVGGKTYYTENEAQRAAEFLDRQSADSQGETDTVPVTEDQPTTKMLNGKEVPWWVDEDYGYNPDRPRKPNLRELTEAMSGMAIEDMYASMPVSEWSKYTNAASEMLYGVVGAAQDTRNWNAIMNQALIGADTTTKAHNADVYVNNDRLKAAVGVATSQMYGGTSIQYMTGAYKNFKGEETNLTPGLYLTTGSGEILRSISPDRAELTASTLALFGVRDSSWIDNVSTQMSTDLLNRYDITFTYLKDNYNPFGEYEDMWGNNFASVYSFPQPTTQTQTQTVTTTTPTTTATTTPQIEEPSPPGGTPPVGDQTYPQYTPPQGLGGGEQYTGTGATVGGYQGVTPESIQAGQQMYGTLPFQYTPTSTYTVGAGGVTGQTQQQQPQQYTVRQFRNASGLSTSITFVDGKPITPIPSGFYPVEGQPMSMGVQSAMVQAPTFAETPMPQATQQAATGQAQVAPIPASSQIVPFEAQQQQAQQAMGTPSGYMPNFTGQPVTYKMATGGMVTNYIPGTTTTYMPVYQQPLMTEQAVNTPVNTGVSADVNQSTTQMPAPQQVTSTSVMPVKSATSTEQQTEAAFDMPEIADNVEPAPVVNYPEGYAPVSFGVQGGTKTVDPFAQYATQQTGRQQTMQNRLTRAQENRGRLGEYEGRLTEVQAQLDALNPVDEEGNPVVPEYRNVRERREAEFLKASRMRDLEKEKADIERKMVQEQRKYDRQLERAQRDYSRRATSYEEEIARDRDREINNFARNLVRFQQEEAAKPAKTFDRMSRELGQLQSNVAAAEEMLSYGNYDNWAQTQIARNPNAVNYQDSLQQAWNTTTGQYQQNKQRLANNYGSNSWYGQYSASLQQTGQGIPLPSTGQDRWISELGMSYSDYLKYMQNPDQVISPSERMGKQWQPNKAIQYGISFNDVYNFLNNRQANVQSRIAANATNNMANGGSVTAQTTATSTQPVGEFAGFRPEALQRIANTVGYQGDMNGFNAYLQNNPAANEQMTYFMNAARKMAKGGLLKAQTGVDTTGAVAAGNATKVMPTTLNQQYIPQQNFPTGANLPQVQAEIAKTPGLPTGATVVPVGTTLEAGQLVSPYSGQVSGSVALPTAQAATTAAAMPTQQQAAMTSAIEATPAVNGALQSLQAAQGTIDPRAQVLAAQQTASSIGDLQAAQGNAILMDNPIQRQIQDGELISGVANAETASAYTEQLQAAQATPSEQATVQGQLEGLMAQFEGGNTPAWAAGSMRKAMSTLAARGLGASSMAGQAVIQAAMEAALPIAQIDAATQSQFEQMNLSNRQQRVMLAAQQRAAFLGIEFDQAFQARVANASKISDIANTNFTTEVQIALENSRIANTMNLQNLNNNQALVMAEAAALSQLDMQNLNNRQQAAVQNAQNFLTMDMANLSNQQQTDLFKAQQRVQSLFTDQAAQNAAQQFNASSENQVNQFFASLAQQTAQFNATQANAQAQFNAGQINTIERFNAEINNQRDQFNAQNRLIIDQSNAQWRREIATADSAAVNRANELNATALIGLSQSAYNNLWQYYRDNMEWAWTSAENERQRITNIAIAQLQADSSKSIQEMKQDYQSSANMGAAVFKVLTSDLSNSILGNLFG